MTLAFAVVIAWITVLVILLVLHPDRVGYAYLLPILVFLVLLAMLPARFPLRDEYDVAHAFGGVVRSAPLLGPVLLGLFAIALFNSSLWLAGNEMGVGRIALVVVLTLGILLPVVRAQLRNRLGHVLRQYATRFEDSHDERSAGLMREILLAAPDAKTEEIKQCVDTVVQDHWPEQPENLVPELETSERKILLAPVTIRLVLTALLVGLIVLIYVYVLAWVAVPPDVATSWTGDTSPQLHVNFVASFAVPGLPYLRACLLLSLIATAGFLGSATLDERVSAPLTDAILGAPVSRFLVLALPYKSMVREAWTSAAPPT